MTICRSVYSSQNTKTLNRPLSAIVTAHLTAKFSFFIDEGSLPLGDSDDENGRDSADRSTSERMSLDSLYDKRYSTCNATNFINAMSISLNRVYSNLFD